MQIVLEDEVKGSNSRRTGVVGFVVCAGRDSRRVERKRDMMEELETGEVEYESVEDFLICLKKEFGGGEKESVKVAELRKLEQGGKTMEEFVQEFKRAARGSRYEGKPLVEEFKRGMNGEIRRKLMEVENLPASIE